MINALHRSREVEAVLSNNHPDTDEYIINIRRDKASTLGVEPSVIADAIAALVKGQKVSSFKRENKLYDVMIEVMEQSRQSPEDITNLFIKSANDKKNTLVPLSELLDVHSRSASTEIYRYNRLRAASMSVKMKSGMGQAAGVEFVKKLAKDVLPEGTRLIFTGETKQFLDEGRSMILIFTLAIVFIYLVMAAQFESWIDPFIIILSVPLSLAGALLTLTLIQGATLNIYSQIGLVTLIGLITKHGILIVDVANKLRDQEQKNRFDAIIEACRLRLRPILMTTFAMVLGAVPLALATGPGCESRRQIGWVIVGGMTIGTIFTLFVLPAIYLYLAKRKRGDAI